MGTLLTVEGVLLQLLGAVVALFSTRLGDADVLSPALPDTLADLFAAAGPLWALLGRVAAG